LLTFSGIFVGSVAQLVEQRTENLIPPLLHSCICWYYFTWHFL